MTQKTKDLILLSTSRVADLFTTYLCIRVFSGDLSIEGGLISRLLLDVGGFASLVTLNIFIISLLAISYNKITKIRMGVIIRLVAIISFIFAIYNLLVYLSVIIN